MNQIEKIISVLYEPDWFKYRSYQKDKMGFPIDWKDADKKLKRETALKILAILK